MSPQLSTVQWIFAVISAVVLFLHGLQGFSRELRALGGGAFTRFTAKITRTRWRGFFVGAALTATIQSSSAVSAMVVALVDAGSVTFRNSLAVLLGAQVGTSSTAWLVSAKLTGIGPLFIVVGTLLGMIPTDRLRVIGKPIFYFGFILFALDLISGALAPLRDNPHLSHWLGASASLQLAALIGLVVTALLQSSSVTSGLAILLVDQGVIDPKAAIALVIGANIGTTTTGLIASIPLSYAARRAAVANLFFHAVGVLPLLPFLDRYTAALIEFGGTPARAIAWSHLLFNLAVALPLLVLLRPCERLFLRWMPPRADAPPPLPAGAPPSA